MQNNSWARSLAYVTGLVCQRLLLQCEYLIAENRILRLGGHLKTGHTWPLQNRPTGRAQDMS